MCYHVPQVVESLIICIIPFVDLDVGGKQVDTGVVGKYLTFCEPFYCVPVAVQRLQDSLFRALGCQIDQFAQIRLIILFSGRNAVQDLIYNFAR